MTHHLAHPVQLDAPVEERPRLRGVLHAATAPLALAAGLTLTATAPDDRGRVACAVFTLTATLLFTTSAAYHTGRWTRAAEEALRRLDHANIFLVIAGTYTPLAVLLLPPPAGRDLLWTVWGAAAVGTALQWLWPAAPRWLSAPVYLAVGWIVLLFIPDFAHSGRRVVLALVLAGGLLYSAGGVVYARKRPNPSPAWFGFHEVFHALTTAAFAAHAAAIGLLTSR
ncbi:channel protein (hemolysin III family) [Streptomyces sp. TLI_235]|nr:hemolysin III family protein [Streptomyces sp. TLI_235]PBC77549.1 channel protein (hemolysin III family) [Streptomyces sp. TLI_235]